MSGVAAKFAADAESTMTISVPVPASIASLAKNGLAAMLADTTPVHQWTLPADPAPALQSTTTTPSVPPAGPSSGGPSIRSPASTIPSKRPGVLPSPPAPPKRSKPDPPTAAPIPVALPTRAMDSTSSLIEPSSVLSSPASSATVVDLTLSSSPSPPPPPPLPQSAASQQSVQTCPICAVQFAPGTPATAVAAHVDECMSVNFEDDAF
ncbi:hypothetical protein GGF31_001279 [Allomyces arbusculus]|nr:hypothetical protein GGF31_001279 [Allomyces arbusculus]